MLDTLTDRPSDATGEDVTRLFLHRNAILREFGHDQIGFAHLTLQEYLAAREAVFHNDLGILVNNAEDDRWREVAILAAGIIETAATAESYLTELVKRGDANKEHKRTLYLIGAAALDVVNRLPQDSQAADAVRSRLRQFIPPQSLSEATELASAGNLVVPLLRHTPSLTARGADACVRTLALIDTVESAEYLRDYASDRRTTVRRQIEASLPYLGDESLVESIQSTVSSSTGPFFIAELELVNVRCFNSLLIRFTDESQEPVQSTALIGENAVGKSTVLRSIAIGVCNEAESTALLKVMPGSMIASGCDKASIRVTLRQQDDPSAYTVTTNIFKSTDDKSEYARKNTEPEEFFPWHGVFIGGYGVHRSRPATESVDAYSRADAVMTLFDSTARLQNPENVMLKQAKADQELFSRKLLETMLLDVESSNVIPPKDKNQQLSVTGPWGTYPVASLSDGYLSTAQWITDFLGWKAHYGTAVEPKQFGGILLLDELEQHLHPRWQRHFLQKVGAEFGDMQVIGTTHTPLIVSALSDLESSQLVSLRSLPDRMNVRTSSPEFLRRKRADQVLSEVFDLVTSRSPESELRSIR